MSTAQNQNNLKAQNKKVIFISGITWSLFDKFIYSDEPIPLAFSDPLKKNLELILAAIHLFIL